MKAQPITVYLPDTREVQVSRYGIGNLKLGMGVFTYSRIAGLPPARVVYPQSEGTCPGATPECEAICYAKRIDGVVRDLVYKRNWRDEVPPIPAEARLLRLHVSGDFDTVAYIDNWIARLTERPDVVCWAYTRSWRVPELLPALERLRALPNMQLFASIDPSMVEMPPSGWRRSWIWRQQPNGAFPKEARLTPVFKTHGEGVIASGIFHAVDGTPGYTCPEETGAKRDCLSCGYCFLGQKHDVVFLEH